MNKIVEWIKSNKLTTILIIGMLYLMFSTGISSHNLYSYTRTAKTMDNAPMYGLGGASEVYVDSAIDATSSYSKEFSSYDRKVVGTYNYDILVKDVSAVVNVVSDKVTELGGFVVSSNVYTPVSDSNTGYLTVRVPTDRLEAFKSSISENSVKIISESKSSSDITDYYYDTDARLETLIKTKAVYVAMLDNATDIEDILNIQGKIINIQADIDTVVGQKKYMEQSVSTTLVSISLATDELELPYAPGNKFRPDVAFKLAVRGLYGTMSSWGTKAIWIAVYSVIWGPLLIIFFVAKTLLAKKKKEII